MKTTIALLSLLLVVGCASPHPPVIDPDTGFPVVDDGKEREDRIRQMRIILSVARSGIYFAYAGRPGGLPAWAIVGLAAADKALAAAAANPDAGGWEIALAAFDEALAQLAGAGSPSIMATGPTPDAAKSLEIGTRNNWR